MSAVTASDPYGSLGVRPIVNAAGNFTVLGGSVPSELVVEAMAEASRQLVSIAELQDVVHARLAAATANEAAYATPGAGAGLYLATMAAVSHYHDQAIEEIGSDDVARARVLMPRGCQTPYAAAVRQAGVQLVEFQGTADLEARLDENVVAVLHVPAGWNIAGTPPFDEVCAVALNHAVPILVDAAAQIPPKTSLWRFTGAGADLALFSGGKGLRGPQASGLVLGRGPVMEWVRRLGYPQHGSGRVLKIGREQLVGLLAAVEELLAGDEDAHRAWCEEQIQALVQAFDGDERIEMRRCFPNIAGQLLPYAEVRVSDERVDPAAVAAALCDGEPRIVVGAIPTGGNPGLDAHDAGFIVNTLALRSDEMDVIVTRLREVLNQAVDRLAV